MSDYNNLEWQDAMDRLADDPRPEPVREAWEPFSDAQAHRVYMVLMDLLDGKVFARIDWTDKVAIAEALHSRLFRRE